jgi:beta propeller repeat protein
VVCLAAPIAAQAYTVPVVERFLHAGFLSGFPPLDGGGISGNRVVYADKRNGNTDIYCYDLITADESRITTQAADQYNPAISGSVIVWEDSRDWGNGNGTRIYAYDLSTPAVPAHLISASPHAAEKPAISGRTVVWQYWSESGENKYSVWSYDLDTGVQAKVDPAAGNQQNPSISGDRVVWQDDRSGHSEIWMARPNSAPVNLTSDSPANATNPSTSGQYVAWLDYRNAASVEVYGHDLLTGGPSLRITNDSVAQGRPTASGTRVVWADNSSGNLDVYCYDFRAQHTWPLTTNGAPQTSPLISGDKVAWQDARSGSNQIYLGELATPRVVAPIAPTVAYGARVKTSGTLSTLSGIPLGDCAVFLEFSHDGLTWYSDVLANTDSLGRFSLTSSAFSDGRYFRVDYNGSALDLSGQSAGVFVKPKVSLQTPVASASMSHTKTYKVHGTLRPKHVSGSYAGTLQCYRLESGHWKLRKSFALTASDYSTYSRYNATIKLTLKGKWRIRAYHSDSLHAATYSGWRTISVK